MIDFIQVSDIYFEPTSADDSNLISCKEVIATLKHLPYVIVVTAIVTEGKPYVVVSPDVYVQALLEEYPTAWSHVLIISPDDVESAYELLHLPHNT